ncbi:MAG: hypothetical protein J0M29_17665 [Chitinophagales bacterium]|nr:hypothetical protein [Chitinophagales bacterium]
MQTQATLIPAKTSEAERFFVLVLSYFVKFSLHRWPLALLAALCLFVAPAQAQYSNLREKVLPPIPLQILDSLSIAPPLLSASDVFSGQSLPLSLFTLENNRLRTDTASLHALFPDCQKILIRYRVLPYNLAAPVLRLDTLAIRRRINDNAIEFDYEPYKPVKPLWDQGGLTSSGAYTRGLSFGNSQNLVFNSNLNLQINGKLGNDLELVAALSDNTIPLQPDGTTRQLQEFDRIFIQLKRKTATLTAGDFDLVRPENTYFPYYFKRLQGAMVSVDQWKIQGLPGTGKIRAAAAVSRGKFARQLIQGQEGNQGPYRLQGSEGERFIIVLAGTEKVYIDGQLLRRGQEEDYVIDYNLGELSFTPRRLITKDIRIIVEFEYAVQTYLRSTVAADAAWTLPKTRLGFSLYSEQDSRNNGGAQELSSLERNRLALAGDNLRNAFAPGVDTLENFDPTRVLYRSIDSVVCGQLRQVLVYSTDPNTALYAARFTEVPAGEGNYVVALSAANGRVFRWSAPDPVTCAPTGNFEPVVKLIAPETKQLYTLGAQITPNKKTGIQVEMALSNRDLNRFSPLGNADNQGLAGKLGWQQNLPLGKGWKAASTLHYEYTAQTFRSLNPYRPAEFVRDWNIGASTDTVAEQWGRAGLSLEKTSLGQARYEFGLFRREGVYNGTRQLGAWQLQHKGWALTGEMNLLQTNGLAENTRFSRPKMELSKTLFVKIDTLASKPWLKLGLYGEREKNARNGVGIDTLNGMSFWYDLLRFYVQTPENQGAWQWSAYASQRNDFAPEGPYFRQNTLARDVNLKGLWNLAATRSTQQLSWVLTYRKLRILAPELTSETPQNTYLGRLDYNLSTWKNALGLTTGYELGSGQSPRIEFTYLAVNPGEGQYSWIDRNRDSILQVDEMELAVFQDQANYVRVAVTTPDYVRTNNIAFNQTLRFEPRQLWPKAPKGWKRMVSRLATQSTYQVSRRTFASAGGVRVWDPFQARLPDTVLVTLNANWRNILFVNRGQPSWDASLSAGQNQSQLALTTGFEQRKVEDYALRLRTSFSLRWSLEADLERSFKSNENQAFVTRNYDINAWELGPKLTWLPIKGLRFIGQAKWLDSKNQLPSAERATQTNWTLETVWNPVARSNAQGFKAATSLRLKGTYADVRYNGAANSAVAFVMLEGLQNGKNYLWSLSLDRQLSKSMQLSLQYEGRKTGVNRVIHVARAQVRAVF